MVLIQRGPQLFPVSLSTGIPWEAIGFIASGTPQPWESVAITAALLSDVWESVAMMAVTTGPFWEALVGVGPTQTVPVWEALIGVSQQATANWEVAPGFVFSGNPFPWESRRFFCVVTTTSAVPFIGYAPGVMRCDL
jgi:hypothetical protein